jgi:predicted DNA-binding protein YlxM (UPF0122 family)
LIRRAVWYLRQRRFPMATNRIVPELSRKREREAMLLRLKGRSHTEIAAELKVTRQAVGQILKRAEKIERSQFSEEYAKEQLRQIRTLHGIADRLVWRLNSGMDRSDDLRLLVEVLRDVRQIYEGRAAQWGEETIKAAAFPGELDSTWGPVFRKIRDLEELTFGFRSGKRGHPAEMGCAVGPADIVMISAGADAGSQIGA